MAGMRELYFNRRVGLMLPLGFASGLPLALTGNTLAAWARESGVSLSQIGLLGLVSWPYAVKFLWAALIDRYSLPFLDRRRSWIIVWQLLLIAAIGGMGFCNPAATPLSQARPVGHAVRAGQVRETRGEPRHNEPLRRRARHAEVARHQRARGSQAIKRKGIGLSPKGQIECAEDGEERRRDRMPPPARNQRRHAIA